ncbi:MAG: aminotransferase class V-fold PLP-dependent enzyme [bacterium]|nr:aminotransferase class V-fold PLP-dependent enzyme [bacterium]
MALSIDKIRADFPALSQYTWFQNGGVSITPKPVADAHIAYMQELLTRGPMHIVYPEEEYARREKTMERIARFFSVKRSQLALMRGVSEAFQTVLRGLDWHAGDRIILSEQEEASLLLPCLQLRDLYGVDVVKVPLIEDGASQVDAVANLMTDNTRLLAFSHVTTDTGFRLPAAELCSLARKAGILSFVDMAHSAGLSPLSLRDLECDFAGLLSYKWMYSPYAAGALFVAEDRMDCLRVTYAGGRSQSHLDFRADTYELRESAKRFQYGPWSWPLVHAWSDALDYLSGFGVEAIEARTRELTQRLKSGLQTITGLRLLTPESFDGSAALVSFELDGWQGVNLRDQLRKRWQIVIKAMPHHGSGLRSSIPFFLLEDEIDLLVEKLHVLTGEDDHA